MSDGLIIALVIIAIVVIIIISIIAWWISTANWFRRAAVKIDEANSGIDVALTKRFDLLTKLLATVKGYAKHESETLEKVIAMRNPNQGISNLSLEEKSQLNTSLNQVQRGINVVLEQYPQLKADSQFSTLQARTSDCEEQLQAARRVYNQNVSTFNQRRVTFPSSFVANRIGFSENKEFFRADEEKREDVEFEF